MQQQLAIACVVAHGQLGIMDLGVNCTCCVGCPKPPWPSTLAPKVPHWVALATPTVCTCHPGPKKRYAATSSSSCQIGVQQQSERQRRCKWCWVGVGASKNQLWVGGMGAARLRGQRRVVTCWSPGACPGMTRFFAADPAPRCRNLLSEVTCKQHSS